MISNTSESIRKEFETYKKNIQEEADKAGKEMDANAASTVVSIISNAVSGDMGALAKDVGGALLDITKYFLGSSDRIIQAGEQATQIAQYIQKVTDATGTDLQQIGQTYAELSQGVGPFNKNISLTNEQYGKFLALQNQLGQMFPSLVSGWDSQGNAILNLKGNVEEVITSLDDLMAKQRETANSEILDQFADAYNGVRESVKKLRGQIVPLQNELDHYISVERKKTVYTDEGVPYEVDLATGQATLKTKFSEKSPTDKEAQDSLENYLNKNNININPKELHASEDNDLNFTEGYNVFDFELTPEQDAENKKQIADQVDSYVKNYQRETERLKTEIEQINQQINQKLTTLKPFFEAILNNSFYYSSLEEPMQKFAQSMVNSIDFTNIEGVENEEDVKEYINEHILEPLASSTPEVQQKFTELFDLQDQLANNKTSLSTFSAQASSILEEIVNDPNNKEFTEALQLSMEGLGLTGDSLTDTISNLIYIWAQWGQQSPPASLDIIKEKFSATTSEIESVISSINLMNAALAEQEKSGQLSFSTMMDLVEAGYAGALSFDKNTGAVTANKDALYAAAKMKLLYLKVDLTDQVDELTESIKQENLNFLNYQQQGDVKSAQRSNERLRLYSDQKRLTEGTIGAVDNLYNNFDSIIADAGNGSGSSGSGGSSSGGGSASSVDTWLESYDKEKADLDYRRKMGLISEEDYLNELTALNDKYFKGREKYQDQYRDNLVEIRGLEESLTKEKIADIDEEISALEKEENTYDDQLDLVLQQRDAINAAIKDARAKGYDIESEYYKSLEKLMDENLEKEKAIIDAKREYEQKAFLEDIDVSKDRIASYKDQDQGEISGELMVEEADAALQKIQDRIDKLRSEDAKANKEEIEKLEDAYDDLYDSRLEGLQMILDAEKKQIDESISAAREALEKERKATEEYYNEEIKAYKRKHEEQEKINTLKEKELQLENLKRQRNVLTYIEGQGFVYTADQEAVEAAQEDLDETREEYEYQAELQRMEDAKERALQAIDDELAKLDEQQEFWNQYFEDFELNSATAQSIHEEWVKNQGEKFVEQTDNIRIYSENYTKYLQDMIDKMRELNDLEGNRKLEGELRTNVSSDRDSSDRKSPKNGYASGSRYVPASGTYLVNENGPEAIFKPGTGTYEYLPQGTVVFSAAATRNLWNWSKLNPAHALHTSQVPQIALPQVNSISIGDVILNGVQDTDRLSREIVNRLPLAMQQEFYKR